MTSTPTAAPAADASELDDLGVLAGRRIGIVGSERPGVPQTVDALVAALEAEGHTVTRRRDLGADQGTSSSQVPVEVSQMQAPGVDSLIIFNGPLTATQFVQQAERQGYFPQYLATDWESGGTDTWAQNMPPSFEGSLAITAARTGEWRVGIPEPDFDAGCRQRYERDGHPSPARGSNEYSLLVSACTVANLFDLAADAAGDPLEVTRFVQAVQGLGAVPLGNVGGGSFRPGKLDASDQVRAIRWHADCTSWRPATPFRTTRY